MFGHGAFVKPFAQPMGGAGVAAFAPTDIAGLELWIKADSLALNDNDPVASWTDLSGTGNHATQGTGTAQPAYKVNIQNSKPAILFDGTSDYLTTTNVFAGGAAKYWIFMVLKLASEAVARQFIHWGALTNNLSNGFKTEAVPFYLSNWWYANDLNTGVAVGTSTVLVDCYFDGTTRKAFKNGTEAGTGTPVGKNTTSTTADIGRTIGGGDEFPGYMMEILVWGDVTLTAQNLTDIRSYLNSRWVIY